MQNNKVSLVKMEKAVSTKIDMAKNIANIAVIFNNIKLSDTELTILAYFMVYGINTQSKNLIVKAEVCKNIGIVKIVMVKLKKLGLIYKDDFDGRVYVSKALKFELTPIVGIYLKLDSTVI